MPESIEDIQRMKCKSTPVSQGQTTETGRDVDRDPTNLRTISKEAVDEKTRASGQTGPN